MTQRCKKTLTLLAIWGFAALMATAAFLSWGFTAGCGAQPAYSIGLIAAAASHEDLLPKTGGFSGASSSRAGASPAAPPTTAVASPQSPAAKP